MGEWIVVVISLWKIFGLFDQKGPTVGMRVGVTTLVHGRTTDDERNMKKKLEF